MPSPPRETPSCAGRTVSLLLGEFLEREVMPNLEGIAQRTALSQLASRCRPEGVLPFLGQPEKSAPPAPQPLSELTFVATNGIGLGHAQRCSLVARELDGIGPLVFAAFPSCMELVKSHGFDVMPLIGRSALHQQSFENDLANYVRLRALTRGGRTMVFDGGYVFDFDLPDDPREPAGRRLDPARAVAGRAGQRGGA